MAHRSRRLRLSPAIRELIAETRIHPSQLVQPHFVQASDGSSEITSLPGIDRNILRIAIYEIKWCSEVPNAVAIDEAVSMAKNLSTDESAGFINGVLGEINRELLVTPAVGDV